MKIVLDDKVVGQLTDDGEIVTEDMWLKELASKIKQRQLADLRRKKGSKGQYYFLASVRKGDTQYYSAVAEILLDYGYGLKD